MQIYLPIAEVFASGAGLLGLGAIVGTLSGIFGVGGGFLITPLLVFIGIPPGIAVATSANQVVASSVSGAIAHWRRRSVDFRMGNVLLAGGLVGVACGITIFNWLKAAGHVEIVVSLSYAILLGGVGLMMLFEGTLAMRRAASNKNTRSRRTHGRFDRLPLKMRFRTSGLYISVLPPLVCGVLVGMLSAIMGVGGGFIMVPVMIYLIRMPTRVVIGTSLYQITFVSAATTFMHAYLNRSVDLVLAVLLVLGAVVGAQIGTRIGSRLRPEQLRFLLAIMVLMVSVKLTADLMITPDDVYRLGR